MLAVLNNPDLAARRAAAKVAGAQAFLAGLLPDPQLGVTWDFPVTRGPGITNAYNLNPNLDLIGLITHSAALKAARSGARQADLDLLWAEWSVAEQSRQMAVTILADEAKAVELGALTAELNRRGAETRRALARGDVNGAQASADLAAKVDADGQLALAVHDAAKARDDLNALLGLAPGVVLDLIPDARSADPDRITLDTAVTALPERRPDLLALKAGYEAQDANVRKAVLSRFPLINLGFSRQSDATNVVTNGLSATLVIPIFNRGRGEIAVQTATREQLRAEYQARLDQTVTEVAAARRDRDHIRLNLTRLETDVPRLTDMAARARAALDRRDIDGSAFLALDQAALKARVALLDERLALALANISLETVLFLPPTPRAAP
jgi:outer membrane protein TolC